MDPFSVLSSVYTAAVTLHSIYSQVRANQLQCATLDQRVQGILPHLRALEVRLRTKHEQRVKARLKLAATEARDEAALLVQLQRLAHVVEAGVGLVSKFNEQSWARRLFTKSDHTTDFAELNQELSTLTGDLHLGVAVGALFDHAKDAADAQADLQQLLSGQDKILDAIHREHTDLAQSQEDMKALVQRQQADAEARLQSQRRFRAEVMGAIAQQAASMQHQRRPSALVLPIEFDDLVLDAEPVGSGGFGDVYRAEWITRDVVVAVKKLRVNSLSRDALAEFQAEVTLMVNVPRHDHVVGLLGVCMDQSRQTYMLVMEWMERGSLYQHVHGKLQPNPAPAFSIHERLALVLQCAKALNHLHLLRPPAGPIVHGDVKTMNFLVNGHGDVKIGDFGLSRIRHESMTQSRRSQLTAGGSVQYTAPELLTRFDAVTPASDIFSLAVVMWEVLTGEVPYKGISSERITQMVPLGKRLPIPEDMHPSVRSLIEQAWHNEPKQRPTCQQLVHAIKALLAMDLEKPVNTPPAPLEAYEPDYELEFDEFDYEIEELLEEEEEVYSPSARGSVSTPVSSPVSVAAPSPPPCSPPVPFISPSLPQLPSSAADVSAPYCVPSWIPKRGFALELIDPLSSEQARELEALLSASVPLSHSRLTRIALHPRALRSWTTARFFNLLRSSPSIDTLRLIDCQLGDSGVAGLADALAHNSTLTSLSLTGVCISPAGVCALAKLLCINRTLTYISLADKPLEAVGVAALTAALRVNRTLQILYLPSFIEESLPPELAEELEAAMHINTTIITLELGVEESPALRESLERNLARAEAAEATSTSSIAL